MRLRHVLIAVMVLISNTVCADLRIQEHAHELYPQRLRLLSLPDIVVEAIALSHEFREVREVRVSQDLYLLPVSGRVSSLFGRRQPPLPGASAHHAGIDIAAPQGTRVCAAHAGVVRFVGNEAGCGLAVEIVHVPGVVTRSCHLASVRVQIGKRVTVGEVIGTVGTSGLTTGPHLHFELWEQGIPVDPAMRLYE